MKKIVLAAIVAVMLLATIGGTVVYAQAQHQPPRGQKLVGIGMWSWPANEPAPSFWSFITIFNVTNPNCRGDIEIEWLSIIDMNGESVFEGAPGTYHNYQSNTDDLVVPDALAPHQIWQFQLAQFVAETTPCAWESEVPLAHYTVEVTWSGRAARALEGWAKQVVLHTVGEMTEPQAGHVEQCTVDETQMMNYSR